MAQGIQFSIFDQKQQQQIIEQPRNNFQILNRSNTNSYSRPEKDI